MPDHAQIQIGNDVYDAAALSDAARMCLGHLHRLEALIAEKTNMLAVLTKAKNAYIASLQHEIVHAKSGIDLSTLHLDT